MSGELALAENTTRWTDGRLACVQVFRKAKPVGAKEVIAAHPPPLSPIFFVYSVAWIFSQGSSDLGADCRVVGLTAAWLVASSNSLPARVFCVLASMVSLFKNRVNSWCHFFLMHVLLWFVLWV